MPIPDDADEQLSPAERAEIEARQSIRVWLADLFCDPNDPAVIAGTLSDLATLDPEIVRAELLNSIRRIRTIARLAEIHLEVN
ncbi:MAG: hypothetical protein ACRD4R_08635 [Candidatus Acidiferrales bacterium]